jgi:nitrogen fixation/metabolism regulation signal transduction histidine kinase
MRGILVVTGVAVLGLLTACDIAPSNATEPKSKSEICAQALGTALLNEASDVEQRDVEHAKQAADLLNQLTTQAQDRTLAQALTNLAANATQAVGRDLSPAQLKAWAKTEAQRVDALRQACS